MIKLPQRLMVISLLIIVSFSLHAADRTIIGVTEQQDIRVAYEIKEDVWEAGVGKALFYLRGLVEAYGALGVDMKEVHVSAVLHGPAAYWVLRDKPYSVYKNQLPGNPNAHIIEELLNKGISVEVCNATLKSHNWSPSQVRPGVTIVHDAYTRLIDLQQRGYGYIRF